MISFKKYLDMETPKAGADPAAKTPVPTVVPVVATEGEARELLRASLESYRSALRSMGDSGTRACPAVGSDLQQNMLRLAEGLASNATSDLLAKTGTQASAQLQQWGDRTAEYLKARTEEVKELLIVLARTAESVGEHDQRYAGHLKEITTRLQSISNLEDLTQVRASLVLQAAALKTYVDQMEQDSHKLVAKLKTDATNYEAKLKGAEERALRDTLTGLANRRNLEDRIEQRMASGNDFCVVMLDLNHLKQVNDKYGHLAGDSLLQQFAQELRSNMRSSDHVGRWGGDEFLLLMDGGAAGAQAQIERLQKWVFGEYAVRSGKGSGEVKVRADAAVGVAQWRCSETMKMVIERADAAMYKQKKEIKAKGQAGG